jgi:hypothetical protein
MPDNQGCAACGNILEINLYRPQILGNLDELSTSSKKCQSCRILYEGVLHCVKNTEERESGRIWANPGNPRKNDPVDIIWHATSTSTPVHILNFFSVPGKYFIICVSNISRFGGLVRFWYHALTRLSIRPTKGVSKPGNCAITIWEYGR